MTDYADEIKKQVMDLWGKTVAQLEDISNTIKGATSLEKLKHEQAKLTAEREKLAKRLGEEVEKLLDAGKVKLPKPVMGVYDRLKKVADRLTKKEKAGKKKAAEAKKQVKKTKAKAKKTAKKTKKVVKKPSAEGRGRQTASKPAKKKAAKKTGRKKPAVKKAAKKKKPAAKKAK